MFSDLYLEALDEELVTLRSSISVCRPASILKVEELGEETQSGESQIVRERDYTVVRNFSFFELGLAFSDVYMYTWTRKGKLSRVIYPADLRLKAPFDHACGKPA